MNTGNPAEMSNSDLEKDVERRNAAAKSSRNQENVNKSTASEGRLRTPSEDQASDVNFHATRDSMEEQDLDDLVHRQGEEEHIGSLPDPEGDLDWEEDDRDMNKISS